MQWPRRVRDSYLAIFHDATSTQRLACLGLALAGIAARERPPWTEFNGSVAGWIGLRDWWDTPERQAKARGRSPPGEHEVSPSSSGQPFAASWPTNGTEAKAGSMPCSNAEVMAPSARSSRRMVEL